MIAPVLLLALACAQSEAAPTQRYAIVVGNNHPLPGSDYKVLQYADDDAIRFARFFSTMGAEVTLLTAPDPETAARFGHDADGAETPTRDHLLRAVARVEAELQSSPGTPSEVYFYYSGHGSVTSVDAFIHLSDGPFNRTDLHDRVLRVLSADRVHIIIDSCHSYFLASARGERVPADRSEFDLGRYPNAGFLLSTSRRKEVHEWSGYQAGVFSYQVLGALQGAADVDGDGVVTYGELQAYVVAANLGVVDPRARIEPFIRRPTTRGNALVDLRRLAAGTRARVPESIDGHFHVLDGNGGRVLDANKPQGLPLQLVVPEDATGWELELGDQRFLLQRGTADAGPEFVAVPSGVGGVLAARGPVADELREHLFSRPLTPEFAAGIEAALFAVPPVVTSPLVVETPWFEDPLTLGTLGAGALATVAAVVETFAFLSSRREADRRPVTDETSVALDRAQDQRVLLAAGYAVGGTLLTLGVLRALELSAHTTHEEGGDR